jgi:hypothetical protein
MSDETTDVEVVVDATVDTEQGQKAETDKPETENDGEQGGDETDAPELTPEERIKKLEQEAHAKQKKIDRQRKALAEADKERAEFRAKQMEFEKVQAQAETSKEPNIDDFETLADYNKARDAFIEKRAIANAQKQMLEQEQARQYQNRMQEMERKFQKDEAEFRQVNPNYDDAAEEFASHVKSINPDPQVRFAIMEVAASEGNASQLINYFGENGGARLDEFERIAAMSPTRAAVEIYKIQQKLNRTQAPATKSEPLPKPPQRAGGSGKVNKSVERMSGRELLDRFAK